MKYTINQDQTLLQALQEHFPDSSNRTLKNWISFGRVLVDEQKADLAHLAVKKGQSLSLKNKESQGPLPILYQDRWIIVINKPAGLLSVPDASGDISALDLLRESFRSSSITAVHRIDQETSGTLVFARGKMVAEKFNLMFESHALVREYAAILDGRLPQDAGTWESYLIEKENYDVISVETGEGKRAITHYRVLRRSNRFSYVIFNLETGKKHQIRVQCADAGHPVAGDFRYGALADPIKRLCLHAVKLEFEHPFTGKTMNFQAPLPKGFQTLGFPKH